MSKCDECTVRKYCDDFVCFDGITCDETREVIEQIRADAIEEFYNRLQRSKNIDVAYREMIGIV